MGNSWPKPHKKAGKIKLPSRPFPRSQEREPLPLCRLSTSPFGHCMHSGSSVLTNHAKAFEYLLQTRGCAKTGNAGASLHTKRSGHARNRPCDHCVRAWPEFFARKNILGCRSAAGMGRAVFACRHEPIAAPSPLRCFSARRSTPANPFRTGFPWRATCVVSAFIIFKSCAMHG